MSLDVYLTAAGSTTDVPERGSGIFVREDGSLREISRAEWDERHPDREPVIVKYEADSEPTLYRGNVTHNLGEMAAMAGIYWCLWRPDEHGITKAAQLIEPLRNGLNLLRARPDYYRQYNPDNGWGDYTGFVRFVEAYLAACERYPTSVVSVSR